MALLGGSLSTTPFARPSRERAAATDDGLQVCHVVPDFDRIGGYERQALTLARQQRASCGVWGEILTHDLARAPRLHPDSVHPDRDDVPTHHLAAGWLGANPRPWWRRHGSRVQLVHAHAFHRLSGQMVALARRAGVPSVVKVATAGDVAEFARAATVHDSENPAPAGEGPFGGPREAVRRRARWLAFSRLRQADAIVAISEQIAAELAQEGLRSVRLPNGVDTQRFHPATPSVRARARAGWQLDDDTLCLAFIGRLAARKDLSTLLRALARWNPKQPWCLLVAGDGERRASLVSEAAGLGLASYIRFLSEVVDVARVLESTDLFIYPSLREGVPNAVLEAWAAGVPSVLSRIPGHVDLPGVERAAWLFAPGDADDLAARLESAALDVHARAQLGSEARRQAEAHFAMRDVAVRYADLYRSLLEARR